MNPVAAAILLVALPTVQQNQPDFSGSWRVDLAKSMLSKKLAGGRVAGVAPTFGDEFTITQTSESITINMNSPVGPIRYRMDGVPTQFNNSLLRATWNSEKLTLIFSGPARGAGGRTIQAEMTSVLHLSQPGVLVVETTRSPRGSIPVATTVYVKKK